MLFRSLQHMRKHRVEVGAGYFDHPGVVFCGAPGQSKDRILREERLARFITGALGDQGPGMPALARLAACWRAAADSGAGLAASVERIASSARADEEVHWALEAELSGPRATARTLALLPVLGIGLGMLLGSDPLGWLLGTGLGHLCLVGGIAFSGAGVWWTRRIAHSVEVQL